MLTQNRDVEMQDASNSTDAQVEARLQLLKPSSPVKKEKSAPRPRSSAGRRPPLQPAPAPATSPSYGYGDPATLPAAATNHVDPEEHIHPELRAHPGIAPQASMLPAAVVPQVPQALAPAGPSLAMAPPMPPAPPALMAGEEQSADGRKAKRELSQSKRAAQNRAAQRAFRQRKEGYIKKLEQQVKDFEVMDASYKELQMENYALREYVINLQRRLLDTLGEYPPPPPTLNMSRPIPQTAVEDDGSSSVIAPPGNPAAGTPLEAVAQAVAGLREQERLSEARFGSSEVKSDDDARTAEELKQQLNA